MTQFDLAYSIATENHGILTASEAKRNGIASKTLARWVKIGRFVKYGNGVYKATQYPSSEEDPYAIAVAQCGAGAYLCGESVLGLLRLMPVNVDHINVRAPRYLRRRLPKGYVTSPGKAGYVPININGIMCQKPEDSIRECLGTHMGEHLLRAAQGAYQAGFIDKAGLERLQKEIANA
jgi:predicted transcriptional regulator of viral defense system